MARTVSRRQLWSRARKLGERILYPLRNSLAGAPPPPADIDALLTGDAADAIARAGGMVEYLRSRQEPRWFPGPDIASGERQRFPEEARTSLSRAEDVAGGRYTFLNVAAPELGHPPPWLSCPAGGKEWTYLLNRFHYLLDVGRAYRYTGDERFVTACLELVDDWIRENPLGHPVTWESVSCAWRIENWFAALLHLLPSNLVTDQWTERVLASIAQHAEYLRDHIEYDLAGNHLLFEAKGLIVAGVMLPELRSASQWREEGLELLRREVARQVLPDGGHGELASHYHVEITLLLTEIAILLGRNNLRVPPEIAEALNRMYRFLRWITRPDGHIPMLGDSVRDEPIEAGTLLTLGAGHVGDPSLAWNARSGAQVDRLLGEGASRSLTAGARAPAPGRHSRVFPSSGYVVARSGWASTSDYMVWDCGPFGMRAGPGHGHADPLSFELVLGGRTVVMDPGVYQYEPGPWRDFFRGVSGHNTVRVAGRDPCTLWSAYRVMHPPRVRLLGWAESHGICLGAAEHDGYKRDLGTLHRRLVAWLLGEVWLVVDWLYPRTSLEWEAFLHFPPGARIEHGGGGFTLISADGSRTEGLLLAPGVSCDVLEGARQPNQGWISYGFGEKKPAPVLRIAGSDMAWPLAMLVADSGRLDTWTAVNGDGGSVLLRKVHADGEMLVALKGPMAARFAAQDLETDGHAAVVEWRNRQLLRVFVFRGRYVLWRGTPLMEARRVTDVLSWRREGSVGVVQGSPGSVVRVDPGEATVPGKAGEVLSSPNLFQFPTRNPWAVPRPWRS
jgi:uncharacterized heparinase superfamily protein